MLTLKCLSCFHVVPTNACLSALGSSLSLQGGLTLISGAPWKLLGEYVKGQVLRWIKIIGSTYTDRKVFQCLNIKSPRTPDPHNESEYWMCLHKHGQPGLTPLEWSRRQNFQMLQIFCDSPPAPRCWAGQGMSHKRTLGQSACWRCPVWPQPSVISCVGRLVGPGGREMSFTNTNKMLKQWSKDKEERCLDSDGCIG